MSQIHYIDNSHISLAKLDEIITIRKELQLSDSDIEKIQSCRAYLNKD